MRRFSDNHTYGDFHSTRVSPIFWKITKSSLIVDFTKARANILNPINPNQPNMTVPKNPDLKAMEIARIEKFFPKKMRTILGYMQLFLGDIAGLLQLQIILFGTESTKYNVSTAELGAGIWCGLVIVIAGGIGYYFTKEHQSFIGSEHFRLL